VARQYAGLIPIVRRANRATFVIDRDGRVAQIISGSDAIDPTSAIAACPSHR
jgi:peroxiredoxin